MILTHEDDLALNQPREAEILADRNGTVLYHRLDLPWHRDKAGNPTHPRRFALDAETFYRRYC